MIGTLASDKHEKYLTFSSFHGSIHTSVSQSLIYGIISVIIDPFRLLYWLFDEFRSMFLNLFSPQHLQSSWSAHWDLGLHTCWRRGGIRSKAFTFHHLLSVDLGFHLYWTIEVTRAHHFRQVLVSCWRLVSFKVSRRGPYSMSPFMRYLFDPRENKKNTFLFSCFQVFLLPRYWRQTSWRNTGWGVLLEHLVPAFWLFILF